MADLETLFPGRELTVGGTSLTVRPFLFGATPRVMQLSLPIVKALADANVLAMGENGTITVKTDWMAHIVELFATAGEDLIALLAFLTGQPREWFDTIGLDDGVALTQAVFEVNADFFVRKVLPTLGLSATPVSDGATSSADSSAPGTDAATSTATH